MYACLKKMAGMRFLALFFCSAKLFLLVACDEVSESGDSVEVRGPRRLSYEIVKITSHDTSASTQGLLLYENVYYESTGGYRTSTLRRVDPGSGEVLKRSDLLPRFFGEGLALRGDRLYQLEWKGGRGFIYDRETFKYLGDFYYQGEGWGLTWNGEHFILSDGSPFLRFYEPESFTLVRSIKVHNHIEPVDLLNELEFVEGKIFANRWFRDEIVVIDPATGVVEAILDLAALERPRPRNRESVLNGIAYDPKTGFLHVTGKCWPRVYILRIGE